MTDQDVSVEINGEAYTWTVGGYTTFLLPMVELPPLVTQYVALIETDKTLNHCTCSWVVHPDDVGMPEGHRRIRKGEPDLNCKVHTREGFILGFFTWLQGQKTLTHAGTISAGNKITASSQDQMQHDSMSPAVSAAATAADQLMAILDNFLQGRPQTNREEIKLTPAEWADALHYVIIDNDGWTPEEWEAQEPCTILDFMGRIGRCTVSIGNPSTGTVTKEGYCYPPAITEYWRHD